jgi:hypothetical protein
MTSLDFLYISLSIAALSIAVFINILLYNVIMSIRNINSTLDHIHSYTKDAVNAKDKVKLTVLKGVQKVLSFLPSKR